MKHNKKEKSNTKINKPKKSYSKYIKISVVILILVIMATLLFMTYKAFFAGNINMRYANENEYKLTNNEIKLVKDELSKLENIDSIDVYTKSKIIKIVLILKNDLDFEVIKEKSNEILNSFDEKNLNYYDVEIFVDSKSTDSIYPKIGYKHKSNTEFSW